MIDTAKLILLSIHIHNLKELLPHILSTLDNVTEITNREGEKVYKGYLKNLRVTMSFSCLKIEGSFLKFLKGSNQLNFRPSEFMKAIVMVGEILQIPLHLAKVVRLDLGVNIPLLFSEHQYYDVLGYLKNFNRHQQKHGLNYQNDSSNGKWYISIYEKLKNVKSPEKVTELFEGQYILRLEFRFLKAYELAKFLEVSNVTPEEVCKGYDKLMGKWAEVFLSIEKKYDLIEFDSAVFSTKGAFDKQIRLMGLKVLGGLEPMFRLINKARKAKLFTYPNQSTNIISRYKTLIKTPDLTIQSGLGAEFERKVRMIAELTSMEQIEDELLEGEVLQS